MLYPEFSVSQGRYKSKKELKSNMEQSLATLENKPCHQPNNIKQTHKYFVSLPTEEAHHGHPTGEQDGFAQRVHPGIITKI